MNDESLLAGPPGRRSFARSAVQIPVTLISSQYLKTDVLRGKAVDLSEGGMGVVVLGNLSPHQPIWIEFTLPTLQQHVQLRAIVRHISEGHCGVQFQSASRDQLAQIQRILAEA